MMAYQQSVRDTHQLILKQATGLTLQIVTMIQAMKAVAMVATMNIKRPITITTVITIISNQEVITMETEIVTMREILTVLMKQTLSSGT